MDMPDTNNPFTELLERIETGTNPQKFAQYPQHRCPITLADHSVDGRTVVLSDETDEFDHHKILMTYDGPLMDRKDLRSNS